MHIALRLSTRHNLAKESEHLNRLKADYHNDIEKYGTHFTSFSLNFKTTVNYFRNDCHCSGNTFHPSWFCGHYSILEYCSISTDFGSACIITIYISACRSLRNNELVVGRLALYILALKSSCHDLESVHLTHNEMKESLLIHLKKEMEEEKQNIACKLFFVIGSRRFFMSVMLTQAAFI